MMPGDAIETQSGGLDAPQRILLVIDDLDALPPARAAQFIEVTQRLLARRGFVTLVCVDAAHVTEGWAGAAAAAQRLQRLVQIPLNVGLPGGEAALQSFARGLLTGVPQAGAAPSVDASRSVLDRAVTPGEADFIATLAPLAGGTPRAVKRFVNIYRLARARGGDVPTLALMLALDSGGSSGELSSMGAAMDVEDIARNLVVHPGEPRLAAALLAVNNVRGKPLSVAEAQAAWSVASEYRAPL